MRLELGKPIRCSDDVFGELADVVIDPISKRVTHLVAEPKGGHGEARLVPIALVETRGDEETEILLNCTTEEVQALDHVQEVAFLRLGEAPKGDPDWDVGVENVLALPYYEGSEITGFAGGMGETDIMYDRVPKGEVEIRRSSTVAATDDDFLGRVDGFVVDGDHITHFVLEHGHLWGKREITIPIGAVAKVETDAITLNLSKAEVEALPSVKVHRWG